MTSRVLDVARGLRLLEPGPVVFVTSMLRAHPNVMTAAWVSPLGFDPPLISLAVHPARLTHEFISKSETFGISIPTMDLSKAVHHCGMVSGNDIDKFEAAGLIPEDPEEIDAPRIQECVAHIECGVLQRVSLADHDLFIGQILNASADDDWFRDSWVADQDLPLVTHIAGNVYAGLTRGYSVSLDEDDSE
jgi:flavin reductase (DIM6/NTAB) family NADH-FMN oxidoreductase RutF